MARPIPSILHTHHLPHAPILQAIGNGSEGARIILSERYNSSLSLEDAARLVVRVLQETMEERVNASNIELSRVVPGDGYGLYTKAEIEGLVAAATADAAAEGGVPARAPAATA